MKRKFRKGQTLLWDGIIQFEGGMGNREPKLVVNDGYTINIEAYWINEDNREHWYIKEEHLKAVDRTIRKKFQGKPSK